MDFAKTKQRQRLLVSDQRHTVMKNAGTALISAAVAITMLAQLRGKQTKDKANEKEIKRQAALIEEFKGKKSVSENEIKSVSAEKLQAQETFQTEKNQMQATIATMEQNQIKHGKNRIDAFQTLLERLKQDMEEVKALKKQTTAGQVAETTRIGGSSVDPDQPSLLPNNFQQQVDVLDTMLTRFETFIRVLEELSNISQDLKTEENISTEAMLAQ